MALHSRVGWFDQFSIAIDNKSWNGFQFDHTGSSSAWLRFFYPLMWPRFIFSDGVNTRKTHKIRAFLIQLGPLSCLWGRSNFMISKRNLSQQQSDPVVGFNVTLTSPLVNNRHHHAQAAVLGDTSQQKKNEGWQRRRQSREGLRGFRTQKYASVSLLNETIFNVCQ